MIKLNALASLSPEAFKAFEESLNAGSANRDGYGLSYEIHESNFLNVDLPEEWKEFPYADKAAKNIAQFHVLEVLVDPQGSRSDRPLILQVEQMDIDSEELSICIFDGMTRIRIDMLVIDSPSQLLELFESRFDSSIREIKINKIFDQNQSLGEIYDLAHKGAATFDVLLKHYDSEERVVRLPPELIRKVLADYFEEFNQAISKTFKSAELEPYRQEIQWLADYAGEIERFSMQRPIQVLMHTLPIISGNFKRLADLLVSDEVPHGDLDAKDSIQVWNKVNSFECVGDFRLGQFSAVSEFLTKSLEKTPVEKDKVLNVLSSRVLTYEPVMHLCSLGESYIPEAYAVVAEYSRILINIIEEHVTGEIIEDKNILLAIEAYVELLDAYQNWWRINSRLHVSKVERPEDLSLIDDAFSKGFISPSRLTFAKDYRDGNPSAAEFADHVNDIRQIIVARSNQFGLVSPIKISSYSIDSIPPYVGLAEEIDTLEKQNLISPDRPFGFSHPTGVDWIKSLVEKHHATIVTATIDGKLGGHCIAVTEEDFMPETYKERIKMVKRLGMIPQNADAAYVEVVMVDGFIRPQFKEEQRRGFVELFGKHIREITGAIWKRFFFEKEEDFDFKKLIPEVWLVAMVGVGNKAAELYESDGWIVNRNEEAIVSEHGSMYFQMCKRVI